MRLLPRREHIDRLLSGSAGVVAASALAVSAYQAYLARQQQRMSAWPYVTQQNTGGDAAWAWRVVNAGVGPALVRRTTLTVDGKGVADWNDFIRAYFGRDVRQTDSTVRASRVTQSSVVRGSVLLAGSTTELIRVEGPFAPGARAALNDPRVRFTVCYCSLYEECWTSESGATEPAPVDACPSGPGFRN